MSGLRRLKFDLPDEDVDRYRVVYRLTPGEGRANAVEVIAVGRRGGHAVYLAAVERLADPLGWGRTPRHLCCPGGADLGDHHRWRPGQVAVDERIVREVRTVNRVKAAFFSYTPPAPPDDDGSYLRWHLLDHMPEQYQLPGIQLALRYLADADCTAARVVADGDLEDVGNLVTYLVGDPVQATHDDFMALGRHLAEVGRFPERRPSLQVRMPELVAWHAAPRVLVSAEVVPFRPHRGVLVVVEVPVGADTTDWEQWLDAEHHPAVLEVPGVAGVWRYKSTDTWTVHPATRGEPQHTTVIYLDEDPVVTTQALRPLLDERWRSGAVQPRFAGPLRSMIEWEAWT